MEQHPVIEERSAPPPRPQEEIQRAHDLLAGLLMEEWLAHQLLPAPVYVRVAAAADVLCWALNHRNDDFAKLLALVEDRVNRAGFAIVNEEPKP